MHRFKNLELRAISVNTLFQFVIRISTSIPTFAATILIAYYAGFEALGSFTKIIAFVSIFYLLVDFGINSVFLKLYFDKIEEKLGNLLLLRALIAIIVLPIIIIIANSLPYNSSTQTGFSDFEKFGILIYSFTLVTTGLTLSLQSYLQKKLSYSISLVPSVLSSLILLILIINASITQNLPLLLLSYVISSGIMFGALFFLVLRKANLKIATSDFIPFSKAILISSFPLGTMLFINLLYSKIDTLILSFNRPNVEVGIYGVSYRFFELSIAIPAFMANSVYPLLLNKKENKDEFLKLFKKYLLIFFAASIFLTISILIFSPILTNFKNTFEKSILPLKILSLSLPFFFLTGLFQWYFLIKGKIKFLIPVYLFAFLINVILNLIFVPQYSYIASAVATGVSEGLVFILLLWYFLKIKFD